MLCRLTVRPLEIEFCESKAFLKLVYHTKKPFVKLTKLNGAFKGFYLYSYNFVHLYILKYKFKNISEAFQKTIITQAGAALAPPRKKVLTFQNFDVKILVKHRDKPTVQRKMGGPRSYAPRSIFTKISDTPLLYCYILQTVI